MKIFKHLAEQPFIAATGVAALVHSTWALGTLFSGESPTITQPTDVLSYLAWAIPAFLIAFSLDVGQIVTSSEIRDGQRTTAKFATFAVFAIATYYLQWLYIAHHMPVLQMSQAIPQYMQWLAGGLRDLALYIIPALLPLSTLLYTFSHAHSDAPQHAAATLAVPDQQPIQQPDPIRVERPTLPELSAPDEFPASVESDSDVRIDASSFDADMVIPVERRCKHCDKVIPPSARSNMRYCNQSCRSMASNARRNVEVFTDTLQGSEVAQ